MRQPEHPMRHFALRIPENLFLDIERMAQKEKRSINSQILIMLDLAKTTLVPPPDRTKTAKAVKKSA